MGYGSDPLAAATSAITPGPGTGPSGDAGVASVLDAARLASRQRAWQEALDLYQRADAVEALEGRDLESLAEAAWFSAQVDLSIETKERAVRVYRTAGDRPRAAFLAVNLAQQYYLKGEHSMASGWLRRAERLLDGLPESYAHGYLAIGRSDVAAATGDLESALRSAEEAVAIGSRASDADLQAYGLMSLGRLRISTGETAAGLDMLEEATMAAVNDELTPFATGLTYCGMIGVCRDLHDTKRAVEWTQAAERWCRRQSMGGFPGICRVHRAEVTALQGAWEQATIELEQATQELRAYNATPPMADGFYALGEIRLRMGDLEAAEAALRQAHALGREPEPALALLRLAQGRSAAALSAITAAVDGRTWDLWTKARLLPAQVEIALAAGEPAIARTALHELIRVGQAYPSPTMTALTHEAQARVALGEGDAALAAAELRSAISIWRDLAAPYEVSRSRALLGSALLAIGDHETADLELTSARDEFARLHARLSLAEVERTITAAAERRAGPVSVRRTFMFTDIEGSTNLAEALGDAAWRSLLEWHDETVRGVLVRHGGEVVNSTGDGFFAAFATATAALDAAITVQRALAEHRRQHGFAPAVRIGLHAAEATRRGGDYSGVGVHVAARVASAAAGGEIVATTETLAGITGATTVGQRQVALKGVSGPVDIVSVEWG